MEIGDLRFRDFKSVVSSVSAVEVDYFSLSMPTYFSCSVGPYLDERREMFVKHKQLETQHHFQYYCSSLQDNKR